MSLRIDSHQHLWRYTPEEFGWIGEDLRVLRRDFLLEDLRAEMLHARVDGAIAVQARQSVEETTWLLETAHRNPEIYGVVGWLPLASRDPGQWLERLADEPLLKGLRHVVQEEPDGFLDRPGFNAGMDRLEATNLVYDLLIVARQLPEAIRFVDRHPRQSFVLDHIAKPRIGQGEIEPWRTQLRALAERENVSCKVSGMVTEADRAHWTVAELEPYFSVVLDAFGPGRLMMGSDWPVLTASCGYAQWWSTVEGWTAQLSGDERSSILGGTAQRIYRLQPPKSNAGPAPGEDHA